MKPPGRDLDVEVSIRILKLQVWYDTAKQDWLCFHPSQRSRVVILPKFSTNLDFAYRIVNSLQHQGYFCHIGSTVKNGSVVWRAQFYTANKKSGVIFGTTLSHAICLAALVTVDGKTNCNNIVEFPRTDV